MINIRSCQQFLEKIWQSPSCKLKLTGQRTDCKSGDGKLEERQSFPSHLQRLLYERIFREMLHRDYI